MQPISAMLASDPSSCPRCQCEAGRRPSGQEGSGSGDSEGGEAEADGDGARSSEDCTSSGLGKEDEEEPADGAARLCGDVWREMRAKLRGIVDSKYFSRGIMMAILVNTVSMGIEHHEQASGAEHGGGGGPGGVQREGWAPRPKPAQSAPCAEYPLRLCVPRGWGWGRRSPVALVGTPGSGPEEGGALGVC